MKSKYTVLIVEDDFRVAEVTRQFVEKVEGFQALDVCKTAAETKEYLKQNDLPDLILLDVFIPDVEGLALFWSVRKEYREVDIIMVTAAKEVSTIQETLRGGTFDYIVKPVEFSRFEQTLNRYKKHRMLLNTKVEMDQSEIDKLTGVNSIISSEAESGLENLPKGIDRLTLKKVKHVISDHRDQGVTAIKLGQLIGASRSTARRYLEYLVSTKDVKAELEYGDIGRPERRYTPL
ncbi:response regulator [Halalkalibacter krulwichiae]|uniref:Transcriptional regulatory protein CitT n=1 Tax=Halalkalibacter krulwichiae TaxID=199441 RepID=A0A1X9ME19_9BACI|nr:response regulator [Halalkalibacter krulwichiae]ARK28682.1 Transcriptional regulatory protein CitT [Halalkalibacter krulwichiae]